MNVINPVGMPPREWVDASADLLADIIPIMILRTDEEWREWGYHVRQTLSVRGILIPDPDTFEFEEWAQRFNQVIAGVV